MTMSTILSRLYLILLQVKKMHLKGEYYIASIHIDMFHRSDDDIFKTYNNTNVFEKKN